MSFPEYNSGIVSQLRIYFVENPKPARQFLKAVNPQIDWNTIELYQHNKHARETEQETEFIRRIREGENGGLLSDAGCPGVADPGSRVVHLAHEAGIEVVPLVGPSSILLTLMASGMNGQNFSFAGYLPKDRDQRMKELRRFSSEIQKNGSTFIFIETPYRAHHLLEDILQHIPDTLTLCAGIDLMTQKQQIISQSIGAWKKNRKVKLEEKLVVFALGNPFF